MKSRVAILTIQRLRLKNPNISILVIVPSVYLKTQWEDNLKNFSIDYVNVLVINTACTRHLNVDYLIVDEIHRSVADLFVNIYSNIKYKIFLGLTATIKRIDGKESYLLDRFPIVDVVSLEDALKNNWVSSYKEHQIILDIDMKDYNLLDEEFQKYFEYFDYDFPKIMAMLGKNGKLNRIKFASQHKKHLKEVEAKAFGFQRAMSARNKFLEEHPLKIETSNLILDAHEGEKCVTFSSSIELSKEIRYGEVFHSKLTKKQKNEIINAFNNNEISVLNTVRSFDEGVDLSGLSVGIVLTTDSSSIRSYQRLGRCIRKEGDKIANFYTLTLRRTAEERRFASSSTGRDIEKLYERDLFEHLYSDIDL